VSNRRRRASSSRLGQDELGAVREAQPERGRLRAFLARAEVAQPAGCHQVDEHDELTVVGGEEQALRAPFGTGEAPPSSVASGGSNVFSVGMCAGPARSIGNALTGPSRARRHASTSGSASTLFPASWTLSA
jgi:hypothetical protein